MKKYSLKKAGVFVMLIMIGAAALNAKTKSKTKSKAKYNLTVGYTSDNALSMPLNKIATAAGYLDSEDVKLKGVIVQETGAFESLSVGKLDAVFVEVITPINYAIQGSDVVIFGGNVTGGMIAVARKGEAEELRDLKNWKGKKLGAIRFSRTEVLARHVIKDDYGYIPGKDITIVNVEDYSAVQLGVVKKNIDIGLVPSRFTESAESSGLEVLFPLTHIEPDYVCCRQTAFGKKIRSDRDSYVALLKSQIQAYKIYSQDEPYVVELLTKETRQPYEWIKDQLYNRKANGNVRYNPDPNYNGVLTVYDTMVDVKYIEPERPLADFFDISLYADALQSVIEENPDDDFYKGLWNYFIEHNNKYPGFSYKAI